MTTNLLHGDCLELMKDLLDGSVDMILTDLPYGTTACKWDTVIPFAPLWAACKRVIKRNGAIVLTASQPFTSLLVCSNLEWFRYEWIWIKNSPVGFLNAHGQPLKRHESVLVFSQGNARRVEEGSMVYNPQGTKPFRKIARRGHSGENYNRVKTESFQEATDYPDTVLTFHSDCLNLHPTQKPVSLMSYLIQTYTNAGETVLDSCMGSGTTGVACVQTGRNFIGIERDENYFCIAQKRIRDAQSQVRMEI